MDRARQAVDAVDAVAADVLVAVNLPDVDPLAQEIRQSIFLLVGVLGLMGMVATALLALTAGSGG